MQRKTLCHIFPRNFPTLIHLIRGENLRWMAPKCLPDVSPDACSLPYVVTLLPAEPFWFFFHRFLVRVSSFFVFLFWLPVAEILLVQLMGLLVPSCGIVPHTPSKLFTRIPAPDPHRFPPPSITREHAISAHGGKARAPRKNAPTDNDPPRSHQHTAGARAPTSQHPQTHSEHEGRTP